MLGRTAESLFWMSRQIERAENMARLAEAGFRISLTPDTGDGHREEWHSTLASAGVIRPFIEKYGDGAFQEAIGFLLFDDDNPSSCPFVPEERSHQRSCSAHQDHRATCGRR